jgi:hypothetical protein
LSERGREQGTCHALRTEARDGGAADAHHGRSEKHQVGRIVVADDFDGKVDEDRDEGRREREADGDSVPDCVTATKS